MKGRPPGDRPILPRPLGTGGPSMVMRIMCSIILKYPKKTGPPGCGDAEGRPVSRLNLREESEARG